MSIAKLHVSCSARMQHGLCGHWSSKQHLQCAKLNYRRRQLLRYGLRALMELNSMTGTRLWASYSHTSTATFMSEL